jgi:hypothetical protein
MLPITKAQLRGNRRVVFAGAAILILLVAGVAALSPRAHANNVTITGTGNISLKLVTTATPLIPSCVLLVNRDGNATWTGFIAGSGHASVRGVSNTCVTPNESSFDDLTTLDNVTIDGRTGSLVITGQGTTHGSFSDPGGIKFLTHFQIVGGGGLEGATGHGSIVGSSTPTTSFITYYAEIQLSDSSD